MNLMKVGHYEKRIWDRSVKASQYVYGGLAACLGSWGFLKPNRDEFGEL